MKKLILVIVLFTFSLASHAKVGVGVILGDPTGLSAKYLMGKDAIDGALSYRDDEVLIYGDYLRHYPGIFGRPNPFVAALTPYVGIGAAIAFGDHNGKKHRHFIKDDDDDFALGGRIPFGVEWLGKEIPIGVALELAPGIVIIPETDAFVQGGLAVRYYF